jgi:hypothetical protein
LQRLPPVTWRESEKFPRFRGVLGDGPERIRTGDRDFEADYAPWLAFISVGDCDGPVWRQICLRVLRFRILLPPVGRLRGRGLSGHLTLSTKRGLAGYLPSSRTGF